MKKVLTCGVFDFFHLGHLRLFEQAKEHGDCLLVAVQDGEHILRFKPQAQIFYSTEQRLELVRALRIVDEACVYTSADLLVQTADFDVFALGEDQNHALFQAAERWCREHGKEVVRLHRTPGISSSDIKKNIMK